MTDCGKLLQPAVGLAFIAITMTACQTASTAGIDATQWYCEGFRPITWSTMRYA